jgi:transcriptional regulator with XRE-family HTH domain
VNALSNLWQKLSHSKAYREAFVGSVVKRILPLQIRVLRKQRNWSQAQLAKASNLTQGVISRAEDPDYGNLTINTLVRIGAGFDCAFVGRFVPFSELSRWYTTTSDEKGLEVPAFADDCEPTAFAQAHYANSVVWAQHRRQTQQVFTLTRPKMSLQEMARATKVLCTADQPAIIRKGPQVAFQTAPHAATKTVMTTAQLDRPMVASAH